MIAARSSGNRHRRRCRRPKGAKTNPPSTINIRAWTRIRGQLLGAAGPIERMTCDQNSGVPGGDGAGRDFSSERSGVGRGVVLMAPQLAIRLMVPACAKATSDDEYPFATIITAGRQRGAGNADGATNSRTGAAGALGNLQRRAEHFPAAINCGSVYLRRVSRLG
jgi:hypothetical protein